MKVTKWVGVLSGCAVLSLVGCGGSSAGASAGASANQGQAAAKKKPAKQKGDKPLEVPADWEEWRDDVKKYGFSLPKGTETKQLTEGGVEFLAAKLPPPHDVQAVAIVWRDKTLSKEALFDEAKGFLEATGSTGVAYAGCEDLDQVFRVCDVEFADEGHKHKGGVIVGTDVSDNYVMIAASPEAEFEKNLPTIGSLLGSYFLF